MTYLLTFTVPMVHTGHMITALALASFALAIAWLAMTLVVIHPKGH